MQTVKFSQSQMYSSMESDVFINDECGTKICLGHCKKKWKIWKVAEGAKAILLEKNIEVVCKGLV